MRFQVRSRHVTTLRVNHSFSPVKTNPFPRASGGHIGSQVTLDKYGHAFVLTDEKPWPPTRTNQQFIEMLAF